MFWDIKVNSLLYSIWKCGGSLEKMLELGIFGGLCNILGSDLEKLFYRYEKVIYYIWIRYRIWVVLLGFG